MEHKTEFGVLRERFLKADETSALSKIQKTKAVN